VLSVTAREVAVGVVAPGYVNVPLWVAQRRGFFGQAGLHVTSQVIGTTEGTTRAVRDGDVDVALSSPEGSIADAAAGGPLRVAAGLIDRPPLSLIALSRHRTFADLRGGRIGTSSLKEGTRHVAERLLAAHGLTYPGDYEWALEGSHVERWKALQAGTIDAALQMIPYDYIAEEAGFTNLGAPTEDFAFNAVCVRRDIDHELLTSFLRAFWEATLWFRGNVAEAAAIAAAETSVEERHALRACRALAAGGVIPAGLRTGGAAFGAAVESLRLSGGLPAGHGDPRAALDYSCLDAARSETRGGTGA
jgi:ABC-type nitrate/sulfonate/bicarbonate transport system substrate-binding protein